MTDQPDTGISTETVKRAAAQLRVPDAACGPSRNEAADMLVTLADDRDQLEAENRELRAVVEGLHKTADGVPVLTGDTVYAPVIVGRANGRGQAGYGIQPHTVISVPEHPASRPSEWRAAWSLSSGNNGPMIDLSGETDIGLCFSTRAAAEAARAGNPSPSD